MFKRESHCIEEMPQENHFKLSFVDVAVPKVGEKCNRGHKNKFGDNYCNLDAINIIIFII